MRHLNAKLGTSPSFLTAAKPESSPRFTSTIHKIPLIFSVCSHMSLGIWQKCLWWRMRKPRKFFSERLSLSSSVSWRKQLHICTRELACSFCHTYTLTMSKDLYIYINTVSLTFSFSFSPGLSLAGVNNKVNSFKQTKKKRHIQTDSSQFPFYEILSIPFWTLITFFSLGLHIN